MKTGKSLQNLKPSIKVISSFKHKHDTFKKHYTVCYECIVLQTTVCYIEEPFKAG